jgi:hypothetical protein
MSLALKTFVDLSMYMPRMFSASPFSDSDICIKNSLESTKTFYDGGAKSKLSHPSSIDPVSVR